MSGEPRDAAGSVVPGALSAGDKARLIEQVANRRRARDAEGPDHDAPPPSATRTIVDELAELDAYKQFRVMRAAGDALGVGNPFFRVHEEMAGAQSRIGNRTYINFSSYNYLGTSGHPLVQQAAIAAIERYGTSVSASRLVSGERPIHGQLESRLAGVYGAEDCIVMVSGHATNVTVIGNLLARGDLVIHDAFAHNSIVQGAQFSSATRFAFAHNDVDAAARLLTQHRPRHRRSLIAIEGHYSMDGDIPDLPAFVALAQRFDARLLVDEAHSLGVLGPSGRGIAEHFGIDPGGVDLWMGTLSKTLAGCGGYIAGKRELIEYLKFTVPGFVYSVGMSPPLAGAALGALDVMQDEPERVARLNANSRYFVASARAAGFDTGLSGGFAIVPIITGSSLRAVRLSDHLFQNGVNVQPILYPAVPERAARLRFFISCEHTTAQIDHTIAALTEAFEVSKNETVDLAQLMTVLSSGNG